MRVATDAPMFLGDFLPALKTHIGNIFRERHKAGTANPGDSREAAAEASRDCEDCAGNGITSRYRHAPDANPKTVSCFCLCALGRWMEKTTREKSPDVYRRIIDLARYPFLQLARVSWTNDGSRDNKFRYPPEAWDAEAERPKVFPTMREIVDNHKAALRGLTLDASDKARVPRQAAPPTAPAGVPAGLTPSQEIFLFTLGDHWRGRLRSMPPEDQAEILADFRDGVENERLISAQRRIAASA